MTLDAVLALQLDGFRLDMEIAAEAGTVTAVLGPNGAGKSTVVNCLAGLLAVEKGHIRLDGQTLDDATTATFVPPEHRRVGVVFQDYLLFPHLTALQNVAFGLRSRGSDKPRARQVAAEWLDRVGVHEVADAKPRALSGGQAQRVALARALAIEPQLLLLDEPLAALDARTRVEIRRELGAHLASFTGTTLLITHDPLDALALADEVIILDEGVVTQAGKIAEISAHPRSSYVADLIGTNLYRGTAVGMQLDINGTLLTIADPAAGPVFATIPPRAVALHSSPPGGSPRNHWEAEIAHLELVGDRLRVHTSGPIDMVAEVTPAAAAELGLHESAAVWVAVKATEIDVYPA
jgi:molybdate transport system ATP-binding protein